MQFGVPSTNSVGAPPPPFATQPTNGGGQDYPGIPDGSDETFFAIVKQALNQAIKSGLGKIPNPVAKLVAYSINYVPLLVQAVYGAYDQGAAALATSQALLAAYASEAGSNNTDSIFAGLTQAEIDTLLRVEFWERLLAEISSGSSDGPVDSWSLPMWLRDP